MEHCKDKAVYVIVLGLIAALFPGIGGVLAVAGVVGGGYATYQLGAAFFNSLDKEQVLELQRQAKAAGIDVPGLDDAASAVGYDGDEPLPQVS